MITKLNSIDATKSFIQFEAISKFAPDEKKVIKALLEGMILKHEAKRWSSAA